MRLLLKGCGFTIFGMTETWTKSSHSLRSLAIPGYKLVLNNRFSIRGGGVGIYILKHLKSKVIDKSDSQAFPNTLEYLLVKVTIQSMDFLIFIFYRPEYVSVSASLLKIEEIMSEWRDSNSEFILMGDLNINSLNTSSRFKDFSDLLETFSISHIPCGSTRCNLPTNNSTAIDHIFISNSTDVKAFATTPISYSDHDALLVSINLPKQRSEPAFKTIRDYSALNKEQLIYDLSLINWNPLYESTDVNEKLRILNENLHKLFDTHIPSKTIRIPDVNNQWITPYLKNLENDREIAYKLWRNRRFRRKGDSLWIAYCKLRNKVNFLTKQYKDKWRQRKFNPTQSSRTLFSNLREECMRKHLMKSHSTTILIY